MATAEELIQAVNASAFELDDSHIIHLFEGGSALHGARIAAKADLDICGVFIEPKANIYGLSPREHFVTSTSDESRRNTADDIDICLYSLKRWAALACKGNPTALSYLFASNAKAEFYDFNGCHDLDMSLWGAHREELRSAILCTNSAGHFSGFVTGQMKRLLGEKGLGKHGQRPELEVLHGYDTKAAMHAMRLCGEGIELMLTGEITYPRPNANELIQIRNGRWSLDAVNREVSRKLYELEEAMVKSKLRRKPDYVRVNSTLVRMYEEFYYGEAL
jgi:uncharacterized protein